MAYFVSYHPDIERLDLPRIGRNVLPRLHHAIEERLIYEPGKYGAPLSRDLKGYRKLRVGDYRIIYRVVGQEVRIFAMGHRSDIYQRVKHRLN